MNAIILAAGLGSRFGALTTHSHKALLPIGGKPNIERTIEYLLEFGINDIYIVVGHLSQSFNYLVDKYNCNLIYNEYYAEYSNLFSFYKALNHFNNSYVIDADVVLFKNVLKKHDYSTYYVIDRTTIEKEWVPLLDENGFVSKIDITSARKPSLLGISFWKQEDCIHIKNKITELLNVDKNINSTDKTSLVKTGYWDDIPRLLIPNMKITTIYVDNSYAGEMDNVENYQQLQKNYNRYNQKNYK